MHTLTPDNIEQWYSNNFESKLHGLRILYSDIEPILNQLEFTNEILGHSENGIPIHKVTIGNGPKRILIWSQMHGNESTGTKAVFDLFKFFSDKTSYSDLKTKILEACTICIIPMLNPDGAIKYTRENANNIDLNRDAVDLKAIESKLLRKELEAFNPEFCFNLHDQRTIFNVEGLKNSAILSFLAPSEEETRALTQGRKKTMSVIVAMNAFMQQIIPNHIGRYTDEFYPTATGDNFQKLGFSTILVEAGHTPNDYSREITRKYNFYTLLKGIDFIASTDSYSNYKPYFNIPNNDKKFLDVIYRNTKLSNTTAQELTSIGTLYKYIVKENKLIRTQHIEEVGNLENYFAHAEIDLEGKTYNQ